MTQIYSTKLTAEQKAAFDKFESVTSFPPFGIAEIESGEKTAGQVWRENVQWLEDVANMASKINFPE